MHNIPAETFPLITFIEEELEARRWTKDGLLQRMSAHGPLNCFRLVDLFLNRTDYVALDEEFGVALGNVLDVDARFLMNVDKVWQQRMEQEIEA